MRSSIMDLVCDGDGEGAGLRRQDRPQGGQSIETADWDTLMVRIIPHRFTSRSLCSADRTRPIVLSLLVPVSCRPGSRLGGVRSIPLARPDHGAAGREVSIEDLRP